MKFMEVLRYELEHRLRSHSTWLYGGFLFLLSMWMFLATADGGMESFANAPERIAGGGAIVGAVGMLVTAALFGDAAVRDVSVEMDPLLFTSPLSKAEYLGGRFVAAFAVNALLLLAVPLGFIVCTEIVTSAQSVGVGPFRPAAYAQQYLFFLLPNLMLSGAILFTTGVLTRHIVPVYLAALGLFISCVAIMNGVAATEQPVLQLLGDPIGMRSIQETTQYWTPSERKTRLLGLSGRLLVNRAVWLTVAAFVLALLHWRFKFSHARVGGRRSRKHPGINDATLAPIRAVSVPRVSGTFGVRMTARQTIAVAARSLADVVSSRWFVAALVACTLLTLLMGWNVSQTVFDTSTWPVTMLVAETVLTERVAPIIYALIALFAGELVWSDRDVHVEEIADAAPVREGVALLGRFMALVAIIVMFQAALLFGGMLIQALQGYFRFEFGLYLRILFGLQLANYLLFAVLTLTFQVLVNQKYLAHMALLLVFLGVLFLRMLGFVDHGLLLYGTDPGWTYSDMNGFGPFIVPFVWFKLYWAAWALLLAVVAALFWVRGREPGMQHRLSRARERFGRSLLGSAAVALTLILVLGGFVFYNTNVLNDYRTSLEEGRPLAEYEKRYKQFETVPQPTITRADLRVEIHPDEPGVDVQGTFTLHNLTGTPIDSVHVLIADPLVEVQSLRFDRASTPVLVDEEARYRIFALEQSLLPDDSMQLNFDVGFRQRGFSNGEMQTKVVANGTHFDRRLMPIIGYQHVFELSGEDARVRFGLAPQPKAPPASQAATIQHRWSVRDADLVQVSAVIGTSADQIAVTPGVLQRSWTENGRRYFHYETRSPISFGGTFFSAKYAVVEDRWNDVSLSVYHHPAHGDDVERTVRSMKASLDYYTEQFGPYPDNQLRVVEFPRYGGFGVAHPHTIAFAESYFLSRVKPGELDQPFYGTAHEIAHTWWGGLVRGAPVRGHGLLSESLANYSAMMVTEKMYGVEAARRVYAFHLDRYLRGRATPSREVPLLEVTDQPYIAYRKGALAMYTLRERMGEEAVNAVLRRFVERFANGNRPYPTSLDLYGELRAAAPDSLHELLADLFETVTLWDVRSEEARVRRLASGEYEVEIDVFARKVRADSVGTETEVPMDELVDIGVYARGEDGTLGEPLYLAPHRVRSGKHTIRVTVAGEPTRAGIDPMRKLIDRVGDNNVVGAKAAPTGTL